MLTPSPLSQCIILLDPKIFKRINHLFLCDFDNNAIISSYRTLARNDSNINLPFKEDETKISYNSHDIPCCQYPINSLYDCLNLSFLDWSIDNATKIGNRGIDFHH